MDTKNTAALQITAALQLLTTAKNKLSDTALYGEAGNLTQTEAAALLAYILALESK